LTKVGSSLGTLNYMSPEQIRGERVTPATDVFSAGIVFYQLASGRHPFSSRERGLAQVVSAIVFETPPKLSEVCPDVPEGLEFILDRALEKDPARRLQNAGDLKQAIALCRMTLPMTGTAPPVPSVSPGYDPGATKVMRSPVSVPPPEPADDGKTRVLRRTVPVAPPASGEAASADDGKTRVMPRSAPPKPVAAPPLAPPLASPPPRPAAPPAPAVPHYSYCPACTSANPPGSAVCQRCQTPLAAPAPAVVAPRSSQMPLYIAIAVAVVLAIVLIVVLLMK
jgi:serine/threonine-protein kinase